MHQRALRYRRKADAYNFIAGRLLLQKGLKDFEIADSIANIQLEEDGKPFLESVFFNISHTSDRVICAISKKGRMGIDIERETEVELENFESFFTPTEWRSIRESAFPLQQFYRYWTRKESIIKALGLKLSYLNQIQLDIEADVFEENGKQWYLKELDMGEGYFGAICSEVELGAPVKIQNVVL